LKRDEVEGLFEEVIFKISRYTDSVPCAMLLGESSKGDYRWDRWNDTVTNIIGMENIRSTG
jgi:hypothetical protein